jgi:hypothetical protein
MTRLSVPDTVGSRALAWLEKEYVRFDVFQDLVAGHPNEARQTAVCELAFALLVLSRDRRLLRDDRVSRLADCLFHIYRNPSFHSYIFDGHPLAFTGHLITWLAVETLKCPVPIPRERIQELAVTDRIVSAQRPAFRTMELRYFLDWGRFRHGLPDCSALFDQTCLARLGPAPSSFTFEDVYEASHVVFYLTDFGRRVPTFPDTAGVRRIGDWLSACLEMLTEFHHWDLVAEVLLSLQCLRAEAVEDQKRAWQALYEAQDPTGAILEGPSGESVQPASVDLVPSEFLALYHRSLVAVLAGFVARGEEML